MNDGRVFFIGAGASKQDGFPLTNELKHGIAWTMVTPGFVREYRNVHLLIIWREALVALATASQWIFIGYSLPTDDVGVRTLLLKTRCVREDLKRAAPRVTLVTGSKSAEETLARYRGIFRDVERFPGNFEEFVKQKGGGIL